MIFTVEQVQDQLDRGEAGRVRDGKANRIESCVCVSALIVCTDLHLQLLVSSSGCLDGLCLLQHVLRGLLEAWAADLCGVCVCVCKALCDTRNGHKSVA